MKIITTAVAAISVAGLCVATASVFSPLVEGDSQTIVEGICGQVFRDQAEPLAGENWADESPPHLWLDDYLARARHLDHIEGGTIAMASVGLRREWQDDAGRVLLDVAIQGPRTDLPRIAQRIARYLTLSPERLVELRLNQQSVQVSTLLPYRYPPRLQVPSFDDGRWYVEAPNGDSRVLVSVVVTLEPGLATLHAVELRLRSKGDPNRCPDAEVIDVETPWQHTEIEFATISPR